MKKKISVLSLVVSLALAKVHAGEIVIIGNNNVPKMDMVTIQKIYTGKIISVSNVNIKPVAVKAGMAERNRFLQDYMNQDEEKYTGYWTVRRYIGKGTPPTELNNMAEVIRYVQSTAGAIGYIDEAELKTGVNVVARK
ncbi:MAG: hypothetical protein Q8N96_12780 [Methylovulum sp.]|nr:hypothetical protein [Methylovulum sp.]